MSAPARPRAAAPHLADRWRQAVPIRAEWLAAGLSTAPADRALAEHHLSSLYARRGRPRPRFHWTASPHAALPFLDGLPAHAALHRSITARQAPLMSDLAAGWSRLRSALDAAADHPELTAGARKPVPGKPWPVLPPLEALADGVPLREVLHQGIRAALYRSLGTGFLLPVRAALGGSALPSAWYGQQDAYWITHYDVLRRLGLARYTAADDGHLDDWAAVARSCGWWWPGEDVCVVVDRPAVVTTEPVPGARHGEVRMLSAEYRDGRRIQPGRASPPAGARADCAA